MNLEKIEDEESRSRDGVPFLGLNIESELERMIEGISSKSELKNIIDNVKDLEQTAERDQYSSTEPFRNHEGIKSEPILEEIDELFVGEEVGHSCDLCQSDLAIDPERPNALLRTLQEACVLACGHVYHFKCLQGTTLDLGNGSTDPSCILCIS